MRKRIFSTLLCLVLLVGLFPTVAHAESEVHWCFNCDALYYGDVDSDVFDDSEGCCGPDGNQDCWLEIHCYECGEYVDRYWTNECCMWCRDCIEDQGTHCTECDECYLSEEDQLCGECHKCEICSGGICPDCGLCDDCAGSGDNTHCIICGACATSADWHDDTHHCADCCSYCEQCEDNCTADDLSIEYCDECGLCMDCCMENREAFGCEVFCVESSEFEEHFCEECGLCKECCEEKLESAQEIRCSTCAGFSCVEQDGFEAHMTASHPEKGYTHNHRFSKSWSMDGTYHWHACLSCENGKDAADNGKAGHTTDPDTGICTVCGYKSGATMYFITQPEDAHVQVSESHYYGSYYWANPGPTNYWNNRTSFRVKAFSSNGPLYYRWYQVKDGVASALSDNTTDKGELYVSGATTPTLTISVSMDSCTSNYSYYCMISDGKGTLVSSSQAKMIASHRYSLAAYDRTTESGSIWLKTYYNGEVGWKNRAQTSAGHKWYCCGEGHGTAPVTLNKKAKSHNWQFQGTEQGAYTKEALLANNCITFNKYRCTDCSYVKYVENHTCNMEAKAYAAGHKDEKTKHQMVCKTAGCDTTGSALHNWAYVTEDGGYFPRQNPGDAANGKVIRRCIECGYLDTDFTWKTAEVTKDPTTGETTVGTKTELSWNTSNILVDVENGTANRPLVEPGDTVVLTPALDGVHKFTHWTANYHYYASADSNESNVVIDLTGITENADGTWSYTIPSDFFTANDVLGGGELFFHGQYDTSGACTHEGCGTTLVGYKAAVCIYTGYSGDTVCAACGGLVSSGYVTPAGTAHTGTLVPVEGSVKVEATCTKDGHEADTRCSACNHVVSGTVIPKTGHTRVVVGETDASCTKNGYSGDSVCSKCDKTFANGKEIPATGHKWDSGKETQKGRLTVITYKCTNEGCDETTTRIRRGAILGGEDTINAVNLNMTGYALGKQPGAIKVTADTETGAKLTVPKSYLYRSNPIVNGKVDPSRLQPVTTINEGQSYYLLVVLTPNEGYTFHKELTNKQITLTRGSAKNVQYAKDLGYEENPVTGDKVHVAVFQLSALYAKHTVTMENAGDGAFGEGSWKSRNTVNIGAGTKDGYTFSGWTSADGVTFADATSANTTFKMLTKDVTVTANWTKNSSGSSGASTYAITVADAANGTVTADRKTASSGTVVTVTVDPDKGYTLETLTVLDKNSKEVKLTDKGNGKYTFQMPASSVTVKATFAGDGDSGFVDVPTDAYFTDAVSWAADKGITGGVDAAHFAPYATCTRAQAVTFLWRAAGCPAPKSTEMPFADVVSGSYYYDAVLWAVENGITKGTTETTFSPNAECSRAQIVTFLWRSQKSPAVDAANPFTDVSAEAYYANAVLWAVENGITNGTTAATFSPNTNCTRAQIVTFIYRCMK